MSTITGLFDNYSDAEAAVSELRSAGLREDDISIVSSNADGYHGDGESNAGSAAGTGAGIGAALGGAGGLLAGLGMIAIPGVGPVVAAGWLAATAAGAVAGAVAGGAAGGLVGALTDSGVPEEDAHVYAEGVRRGGTLVTARVADDSELEPVAQSILRGSNQVDVASRRSVYAAEGWSSFDETADPYSPEEIEKERARYGGDKPPLV
ncbi:general stress protein [Mesorhizobium sp. SB112]|uniref:general stress protein n=1 Tax=Mesorhizobium sp. SB112 TaxID=3151853 RepID=UPI003266ED6E